MATTGAAKGKSPLPKSATIIIHKGQTAPHGEVEVTPDGGRVHFTNEDKKEYRLRLWPVMEPSKSIDILVPTHGTLTILIRKDDEFLYRLVTIHGEEMVAGPGGPIRN